MNTKHKLLSINLISIIVFIVLSTSCDVVDNSNSAYVSGDWLIPESQVFDGGPGKDGIPALLNPELVSVTNAGYLSDNDLVLIVEKSEEVRIYPHPILDWHEIINDKIGNKAFAVTYCPLTGSGICWDRVIDGTETTFGVSGLLYNTNLIPYDRKTNSNWSQMRLQSVNGELKETFVKTLPIFETSWATAKQLYPNAKVVSTNTGFSRSYGVYPYGNYKTSHSSLLFPVNHEDNRLNAKERVLGILGESKQKAYRIADFVNDEIIVDTLESDLLLIYGNNKRNIITAFKMNNTQINKTFSVLENQAPYILVDNEGTKFDSFGNSDIGPAESLIPAKSFVAYWFAWAAFYPLTDLYGE